MSRSPGDKIVSLGDDFRQYPKEFWGTRDRARAAAEDSAGLPLPKHLLPLAVPMSPSSASAFTLYPEPRPPRDNPGPPDLDDLLFKAIAARR